MSETKHTETKFGYKKTKLGWLPEEWKLKKLGKLFEFRNGVNASKEDYGQGIKFVNVMDVLENTFITEEKILGSVQLTEQQIEKNLVKRGDVLFNRTSETQDEIGLTALYDDEVKAVFGGFVIRGRPKNNSLDHKYNGYSFHSELVRKQIISKGQGAVRVNVGQSDLEQVLFPIPPLSEQKKIAEILSTWDRAIETLEQLIAKKEELKKGLMQQLLTGKKRFPGFEEEWKEARLDKIAKVVMGQSPKSEFYNDEKKGIPLLQGNNDIKNEKTVSNIYTTEITKECNAGDIILSVRAPVGDIGIATERCCIGRGVCAIQAKSIYREYLFNYLDYFEYKWDRYSQGSTFKAINSKDIRAFKIDLPISEKEIISINNTINSVQKEIEILRNQKQVFEIQKKGLMQQLLTGKMRIKGMIEKKDKKLKELMDKIPSCLVDASNIFEPNSDFLLASEEILAVSMESSGDEPIRETGKIILRLRPEPRLIIELESNSKIFFNAHNQNKILIVKTQKFEFHTRTTNLSTSNLKNFGVTLSSTNNRTKQTTINGVKQISFYVINFPMCFGKAVRGRNNPNFCWRSRLVFEDEDWKVTLDKMENSREINANLKTNDGFTFTYAGIIEKINGDLFDSADLLRFMNRFNNFLSFARGANASAFNIQGYSDDGEIIWKDWSLGKHDRWSLTQDNWLCDQHAYDQLHELFPKWSKLLNDELWKKEIPKILYWYCYAGRNTKGAGTDGSLILAIAALELFSFNFLVRHTSLRGKEKYESKHLSNNIYKMLEELDIPVVLPKHLKNLYSYSMPKDFQTGPKSITEIRNEIVHPDRESAPDSHVCYEALQLALWYIEMAILRLCNFYGVYSNRLIQPKCKGVVEQVPWTIEVK